MTISPRFVSARLGLGFLLLATRLGATAPESAEPPPSRTITTGTLSTKGLVASATAEGWHEIVTTPGAPSAEFSVQAPVGGWDLGAFAEWVVPLRNLGPAPVRVTLHIDDGQPADRLSASPLRRGVRAEFTLPADGSLCHLVVPLAGLEKTPPLAREFVAMVGLPHEFVRRGAIIAARVQGWRLVIEPGGISHRLVIGPPTARGVPAPLQALPAARIFPLVDAYGQYRHREWPGKIQRDDDFAQRLRVEEPDLAAHARPADWDRYGGWTGGPQLAATGFFRVEQVDGVWWWVDPDGRLFWSHGVVRVGTRIRVGGVYRGTPLADRERTFLLPPPDSPLAAFYGTEPAATRGYYVGRPDHAIYDHLEANLWRKYGPSWNEHYARHAQRRLASWGLNTIANSSDPLVYRLRQTPYTAIVYSAPLGRDEFRLQGSTGNWGKLPDPFDPGWRQLMRHTLETDLADAATDPWCLGFFVDNELAWNDAATLAEATLRSPAAQPAKAAFLALLRTRYDSLAALNAAWGTTYASWDAWLAGQTPPPRSRAEARTDFEAFGAHYLETYFAGCRAAIREFAPQHLYLGCRFAQGANALVMRIAARHCDVISINRYTTTVHDLALPAPLDRPILIGEFHFGALDRGPLAAALVPVPDQAARAVAYRVYVESALRNPAIIGTHWFQYFDQPTTGRFDGENYQTGLVDLADTPYPETIAAVRQIAQSLYTLRAAVTP